MTPAILETFLARLAPELGAVAVVFSSALPEFREADEFTGMTASNLDVALSDHLRLGGRRPVVVLNDRELIRQAEELVVGAGLHREEADRRCFGAVLVHELGHVLDRRPPYLGDSDWVGEPVLMGLVLSVPSGAIRSPDVPAWHGHELAWLRVSLHLAYRATRLGWPVPPSWLGEGEAYGLSHFAVYAARLGDEPEQMRHAPVEAIKATKPPAEFTSLWEADTRCGD
jgi:hypothetical protein